jgi:hypothetical protein
MVFQRVLKISNPQNWSCYDPPRLLFSANQIVGIQNNEGPL